jgi:hypothetical protein
MEMEMEMHVYSDKCCNVKVDQIKLELLVNVWGIINDSRRYRFELYQKAL